MERSATIGGVLDGHYYERHLAADRLRRCYELAPSRVRRYLEAEVSFVVGHLGPGDIVLDLGCGYGRTLGAFGAASRVVVGADSSFASLQAAREITISGKVPHLVCTDAAELALAAACFDRVVCIQNGISAFHVDPRMLVSEALRVLRPGGTALFSTYSGRFWDDRLAWFERQAAAGLIGEIDWANTGNGTIVCKDGFTATTESEEGFRRLTADLGVEFHCVEVDESSLFFLLTASD